MRKLYRKYLGDIQHQTTITNTISLTINAITGIGQLILGILLRSPWYIVNSAYHLLLCLARIQALKSLENHV